MSRVLAYPLPLGLTTPRLDIIFSEDEDQNHIVAQCRLPFSFNFLSKLPPGLRLSTILDTRKRRRPEQDVGDPPASEQRVVRPRMDDAGDLPPTNPPGNEQIHHLAPDIGNQYAPRGHNDSSSSSLPLAPLPQPAWSADVSSAQLQAISPPKIDGLRPPTLTEVNPDSGSITGGVRIWLKGMNFPALLPLFARFGAAVVPTVSVCFCFQGYLTCFLFARLSLLPPFLPVICLPEPCQASSILRCRSIHNQMRRSMEPASRPSNTKGIMMNCESLERIKGHVLTRMKNLNTSTYSRPSILPAIAGGSHYSQRPMQIGSGSRHQHTW